MKLLDGAAAVSVILRTACAWRQGSAEAAGEGLEAVLGDEPVDYASVTGGQLEDWERIGELVTAYASLRLGGTDASVITLAERLGAIRIATLNHRLFGVVRPRHAAEFYKAGEATLGRAGGHVWFMPEEDSVLVRSASDAARYTGNARSVSEAYTNGEPIYGVNFPTEGLEVSTPTAAEAGGWPNFLEGGRTAVLTEGGSPGYLMNPVREFITPGGVPVPSTAASSRFLSCCDVRVQDSGEMAAAASGSCVCDDK